MASFKTIRAQRGVSLLLGTAALVFIVPLIGLVIDLGILYSAKSRLQAAVDGAALAAARALNVGETDQAQTTNAADNAVAWFYANFQPGNWSTTSTQMDNTTNHVTFTSPGNVRTISVTASTTVPTWFMRYFGFATTTLTANGTASRRDIVMMLVLDRSYSMQLAGVCNSLITSAKQFVGQFEAGRDKIGLVTFAADALISDAPSTSFQTNLGYYVSASQNGSGDIDNIVCNGNTNSSQAISLAYNELWKINEPGALNIILFETDGIPNTATMNFYNSSNGAVGLSNTSNCRDTNNKTISGGGFGATASFQTWTQQVPLCGQGHSSVACGTNGLNSYLSGNPTLTPGGNTGASWSAGLVGAVGSADPGDPGTPPNYFIILQRPYIGIMATTNASFWSGWSTSATAPGCSFDYTSSTGAGTFGTNNMVTTAPDFAWFPATDVYGNSLYPATNPYQTITTTNVGGKTYIANTGWTNWHMAATNAADNAAYNARVGVAFPSPNASQNLTALIDVIGLGGTSSTPADKILLQRIANDPNGDEFNSTPAFNACSSEGANSGANTPNNGCVTYSSQPQGLFVWSPTSAELGAAFLSISSQVLRLSH